MNENVKDWKTTLSGLALILATAGGGILKIRYPQYAAPIETAMSAVAFLGG
jgi:hypothetical protein